MLFYSKFIVYIAIYVSFMMIFVQCNDKCYGIHHIQSSSTSPKPIHHLITHNTFSSHPIIHNHHHSKSYHDIINIRGGSYSLSSSLSISLPMIKIILQVILTIIGVSSWLIPLLSSSFHSNMQLLSYGNAFAGGVFLMLGLGHMIPSSLQALSQNGYTCPHPYSCYFVLLGYALIMFVEKVAFNTHELMHHNHVDHKDNIDAKGNLPHPRHDKHTGPIGTSSAVILTLALSIHSLFESLALGMSSDATSASLLAASVGVHQPAESLALLVTCLRTNMQVSTIIKLLAAYSMMAPAGVLAGILIQQVANPVTEGLILAMTAGTFLYVGATEIVNEEFEEGSMKEKYMKFAAFISGIALLGILQYYSGIWEAKI